MNETSKAEDMITEQAREVGAASIDNSIILPGGGISIQATADELFRRIGPTKTLFMRGGAVVGIFETRDRLELEVISPAAARSRFESYATFYAYRMGGHQQVLKPTVIPQEMATALLESEAARQFLPKITGLINCPIIVGRDDREVVEIIDQGFHPSTGLFITGGELPPNIEPQEAGKALKELVSEFDFQSRGDRSRALALFITPALKLGGHLLGNVPVDVAEADKSQSGKTFRQKIVAAIYNEKPSLVTSRSGGVGSVDESLNQQLIAGHPFIQLDNFRGRLDSPHIEALLTAERSFSVRVPYCREVVIDPSRIIVMLTSNGVETTRDFANRSSIVRIRKREGHAFRQFPEGDLLQHVRANQSYYLGVVFAIVREWIRRGRLRSQEMRHDFREWCQTLDWIIQDILGEASLMDGHEAAQERVSDPALTFLRKLTLAVVDQGRAGEPLIASTLYEIADAAQVPVPGLREPDEDKGKRAIGMLMARLFKTTVTLELDGFRVTRRESEKFRGDGGGNYIAKEYLFTRLNQ